MEGEAGQVRSLLGQCMRGPWGRQGVGGAGGPAVRAAGLLGGRPPGAWQHLGERNPAGRGPWSSSSSGTGRGSQREVSPAVWPRGSWEGTRRWGETLPWLLRAARPAGARSPPDADLGGREERVWGASRGSGQASWPRPPAPPAPCPGSGHLLGRKGPKSKGSSVCGHLETQLDFLSTVGEGAAGEGAGEGHPSPRVASLRARANTHCPGRGPGVP